ncbi:MAG: hypothetical protein J6K03_00885 [Oscillospiraceae bacterium]|nr:hypothetical protein [Oscillospiraceae bacterium]
MKKALALFLSVSLFIALAACSRNLTDKNDIVSLFRKNEQTFLQAANSGDYSAVGRISGVQKVYASETYVDIQCGGAGLGSSTHYYGIFYSADDDLSAVDVAGPRDKLVEYDDGYLYQEDGGDNRYYVEPLGNHFYYYEAHF